MVVMINGSFGVGKTTVARLLRDALPGSVIYDPEWAGFVLQRLPGRGRRSPASGDFQHMRAWRRSAVAGVRLFRAFARGAVIVPMAFTDRAYFDEVTGGIRRFEPDLRIFLLRASEKTVQQRLAGRGTPIDGPGAEWIARRVRECVEAHRDPHFGEPVDTEARTASEVAGEILRRLELTRGRPT
ncbi:MAG TPA: AAA family ATPase [Longimicrobium sp.]|nr:AAA family ATPase [Longimicrobium sp.]